MDRQTYRQTDIQTDRHTDRQRSKIPSSWVPVGAKNDPLYPSRKKYQVDSNNNNLGEFKEKVINNP